MKTRILTLTLALLLVVQLAYATVAVPSSTNEGLYNVTVNGFVIQTAMSTNESIAVLANVTAAMKEGNAPVVSKYFKDERKAIQAVLPAGTNANALQLMELSPFPVFNNTAGGDLTATFTFPTQFVAKPLVVMVGQVVGNKTTWSVLKGFVNSDGSFNVTLPANLLRNVSGGTAVISIMQ